MRAQKLEIKSNIKKRNFKNFGGNEIAMENDQSKTFVLLGGSVFDNEVYVALN